MLLQPITVQFSKSTLKPSAYTLTCLFLSHGHTNFTFVYGTENNIK